MFLVDYGNCEIVDIKDVQPLPVCFLLLFFQAIECCLVDIVSTREDDEWDETLDQLVEPIGEKVLLAQVDCCVAIFLYVCIYHRIVALVVQMPAEGPLLNVNNYPLCTITE